MRETCPCESARPSLLCARCAGRCCAGCAVFLDAATYCAHCAESLLDEDGVPSSFPSASEAQLDRVVGDAMRRGGPRWLILVARDQADLYGHLVRAFSRDAAFEVLVDRRKDGARNPPGLAERLRIHGAAVIRRRA